MIKKLIVFLKRCLPALLAAVLLGTCIYSLNARFILGNPMPMPFGIGTSVVLSGSMEPALSVNDLIVVRETDEFYVNQIVVFQSGSSLTVHRIIGIDGDRVITQGDANNTADAPVTQDAIKGEVILAIPYAGILVDLLKRPGVAALLVGVALWLMERSFRKDREKEQDELKSLKKEIEELAEELQ